MQSEGIRRTLRLGYDAHRIRNHLLRRRRCGGATACPFGTNGRIATAALSIFESRAHRDDGARALQ